MERDDEIDTWREIQRLRANGVAMRDRLRKRKAERISTMHKLSAQLDYLLAYDPANPTVFRMPDGPSQPKQLPPRETPVALTPEIEAQIIKAICDFTLILPFESRALFKKISKSTIAIENVDDFLRKLHFQGIVTVDNLDVDTPGSLKVSLIDYGRVDVLYGDLTKQHDAVVGYRRSLEDLLTAQTAREKEIKRMDDEITALLHQPSYQEQATLENFRSASGWCIEEFCKWVTREQCARGDDCPKLHFNRITHYGTDESLGDCSFLNTCFHVESCKFLHFEVEKRRNRPKVTPSAAAMAKKTQKFRMIPPQWVQCDLRSFDLACLGKFAVVMADPPWDIHMELPYGTMADDEMRKLNIGALQDDGFIFLWVTGRAMELGRTCLKTWGYEWADELVWIKTNQLQRLIRTGRTGHWLNHGKEHCLVGVKGDVSDFNLGIDCDLIVSEVRATSHKPDEIYGIIERLAPGRRKLELFGRPHNSQPNWTTLGNQVDGVRLVEHDIAEKFMRRYPDGNCMRPPKKTVPSKPMKQV